MLLLILFVLLLDYTPLAIAQTAVFIDRRRLRISAGPQLGAKSEVVQKRPRPADDLGCTHWV